MLNLTPYDEQGLDVQRVGRDGSRMMEQREKGSQQFLYKIIWLLWDMKGRVSNLLTTKQKLKADRQYNKNIYILHQPVIQITT